MWLLFVVNYGKEGVPVIFNHSDNSVFHGEHNAWSFSENPETYRLFAVIAVLSLLSLWLVNKYLLPLANNLRLLLTHE
jgi:hypothetical protein